MRLLQLYLFLEELLFFIYILIPSTKGLVWWFIHYRLSRAEGKKEKDAIKPSTPWFQEKKST